MGKSPPYSLIHSKFFSVDAVERQDGVKRIVEIGDGKVSDLVG
ncbi:ATP-grasp domain-containing protein [Microcoleus vaginatus DQ-U2]